MELRMNVYTITQTNDKDWLNNVEDEGDKND